MKTIAHEVSLQMLGMALGRRKQESPRHSPGCPGAAQEGAESSLSGRLWARLACVLAHPNSGMAWPRAILHPCTSVSLSVAGDGDAEGKIETQRLWKMLPARKEPIEEG